MADAATLSVFHHLFASVAEEMGGTLERAAYSPNIKERLDFSCALFLGDGKMLAQAAHIPVHLGAMPESVRAAIRQVVAFHARDVVILNDPYLGGTHLPDVTLVSPVFRDTASDSSAGDVPDFFVASRAHHADIGGMSPGSMPLSTELHQEGLIIPPIRIVERGTLNEAAWTLLLRNVRTPVEREGDLAAQLAAHRTGARRLQQIVSRYGLPETLAQARNLIAYSRRMAEAAVQQIPDGAYGFADYLDDDGQGAQSIPINLTLTVDGRALRADFAGTAAAVRGNVNAVPAIVRSAVVYCLRCVALALLNREIPMNEGLFNPLTLRIPAGSLLDPPRGHAVAAGNVETSQRVVDVVMGALAQALPNLIPAASQGTMNNFTFGGEVDGQPFAYYETLGGGIGAGPTSAGGSGMHSHMSNTRNTPVEALESTFPLRVEQYALRSNSGGKGRYQGGDGLIRRLRFLAPADVTITSERRSHAPYGLNGGEAGRAGKNSLIRNGQRSAAGGKASLRLEAGDVIIIETPGGGGWGQAESESDALSDHG